MADNMSEVILCMHKKHGRCCLTAMYVVEVEDINPEAIHSVAASYTCATHADGFINKLREDFGKEPTIKRLTDIIEGYEKFLD